jgi:LysR family transcriptional activator of mexEF-oprN operon
LVDAVLSPGIFDPAASDRTLRLGLSDASESWLLPPLLGRLEQAAPHMRLVVLPVQFRTVGDALATHAIDLAVTVADELPNAVRRQPLFTGGFVCLFDPRHAKLKKKLSLESYLEHKHVVVSYNGDLRGIVEDVLGVQRDVRVSVPSFQGVGAIVDGGGLLATIPEMVARQILALRPHLRTASLPFVLSGTSIDLLWTSATSDDPAVTFLREEIVHVTGSVGR